MAKAKILTIGNQKGGVGKTAVTLALADMFSSYMSKNVLVIDTDPQANSTRALGYATGEGEADADIYTLAEVYQLWDPNLTDEELITYSRDALLEVIQPARGAWVREGSGRVDVVPATPGLTSKDSDKGSEHVERLAVALAGDRLDYDMILIDCPPAMNMLTINALAASDYAFLVTELRSDAVRGLDKMVAAMSDVVRPFNPDLIAPGWIINKAKQNSRDQEHWRRELIKDFDGFLIDPPIPEREIFARVTTTQSPVSAIPDQQIPGSLLGTLQLLADKVWSLSHE